MRLLDVTNVKTRKGLMAVHGGHYLTGILYMAPAATGGGPTVCPFAGSCIPSCLAYSGNEAFGPNKRKARAERRRRWIAGGATRRALVEDIARDISMLVGASQRWPQKPPASILIPVWGKLRKKHGWPAHKIVSKSGKTEQGFRLRLLTPEQREALYAAGRLPEGKTYIPVVRLNGTSDIAWETETDLLSRKYDGRRLQFYDYTKRPDRMFRFLDGSRGWPDNYYLTFSWGGRADHRIPDIIEAGGKVTVVFDLKGGAMPTRWGGWATYQKKDGSYGSINVPIRPVIDGDGDDLRFLDEKAVEGGAYIGLKYKKVTYPVQAALLAEKSDPFKGFIHSTRIASRPNPGMCAPLTSGLAFRFGCGGFNAVAEEE